MGCVFAKKQNRESTEGCSIVRENIDKFGKKIGEKK